MNTVAAEQAEGGFHEEWETGPTVARMVLGAQLRRLREANGHSLEEAETVLGRPREQIARIELGRADLRLRDVAGVCTAYGVTDRAEVATLLGLARQANAPRWWSAYQDVVPPWYEPYLELEQSVSVIRAYEAQVVPDLLQTEAYTRALLEERRPAEEAERLAALRALRRRILHREPPVRFWAVIEEAALLRGFGGRAVTFAQFEHLLDVCDLPHVTLQVLPLASAGAPPVTGGSFTLLRPPQAELPDVVYVERLNGAVYPSGPGAVSYWHTMNRLVLTAAQPASTQSILWRILRGL
ncbi:helix-turn-helix domain-containing protein [Actinomadura opuntiae]|uniref:helix-turn-helix domain-containing protein n=1 Tax=Actinomadura sp. OS1-43 TaxID=604315 RepID=UPI00255B1AB0|nr:helix-turn-helix transcriptional regulator [Actinomadura sp. OS1-43]MDL4820486.1 helix-turn-helix transcriptional regulator [Actinomadura sp. OS1-43]